MVQTPTMQDYDEAIVALHATVDKMFWKNPLKVTREDMESLVKWALALQERHGYLVPTRAR